MRYPRVNIHIGKLFSLDGRLARTGFLHSLLVVIVSVIGFNLLLDILLSNELLLSVDFLVAKRVLEIAYLAVLTPFIVRRLHDVGLDGKWVIPCWISVPLDQRFLLLVEVLTGVKIIAPVALLMAFDVIIPATALLLLLKPGDAGANRWGEAPD